MSRTVTRREFLRLTGGAGIAAMAGGFLSSSIAAYASSLNSMGRVNPERYVIMILVDGLRSDLFFEMLEANELPNIKEHLVDRGAAMECVAPMPSTTGPAHLPFLTGTFPGRNNVSGIRWVDRKRRICRDYCSGIEGVMINEDYGLDVPTLFEVLEEEETAAIYGIVNKGAKCKKLPGIKEAWWGKNAEWERFDQKAAEKAMELYTKKRLPRFTFVWMPGVDHIAHFEGPKSERVRNALKTVYIDDKGEERPGVDGHIGKIVNVLKEAGIYDETLLCLVADHGLRDTEHNGDLAGGLKELGLKVKGKLDTKGDWGRIHLYNAVVAVSGNAFAHVYLCDDTGRLGSGSAHGWIWEPKKEIRSPLFHGWKWKKGISYEVIKDFPLDDRGGKIDLIDALLDLECVGLLLVAGGEGKYHVYSSSGEAIIEEEFAGYEYPVVRYRYSVVGDDPLGYADEPGAAALMADGRFHSGDEWLKASWSGSHPDAIVQFCQIFKSQRCGDIVVLAKPGWDLMDEDHIASHGSIERAETMVPAVLAGSEIINKRLGYARTADIFPTCTKFLGLNPLSLPMDGRTLDIF